MPGLFGILAKTPRLDDGRLRERARRMSAALRTVPWLEVEHWDGPRFSGGRVHLGLANPEPQPIAGPGGLQVWFDGELYPPGAERGITPDAERARELLSDPARGLAEADGVFALACYDPAAGELALATDRLGFRPLYWAETEDWFAYASEVKALLAAFDTLPPVDRTALLQFFGFDYMLGERTWWRGIRLLPPATVRRVAPGAGRSECRYWTFDAIRREPRDEVEVIGELARLWSAAVRQRSRPGLTPLLLSGGLDSRLILAELVRQGRPVRAITFGEPGCPDLAIARAAARRAGAEHRAVPMDRESWWRGRDEAIWQTDGLVSARHLHVAVALPALREGNRWTLKNASGDVVFGGSGLRLFGAAATEPAEHRDWAAAREEFLRRRYLPNPFFTQAETASVSREDCEPYLAGPSVDCFVLRQGQRRWTLYGPLAMGSHCEVWNPAASLGILRLVLGHLTEAQRAGSRFYARFLCATYPELFGDIPWQATGRGLRERFAVRLRRGLAARVRRWTGRAAPPRGFANYERLVAGSGVAARLAEARLVLDEVMDGAVGRALRAEGLDARVLLAAYTAETYLRQAMGLRGLAPPGG